MLPRGDDKDQDDFHLFTRTFTACIDTLRICTSTSTYDHLRYWGSINTRPAQPLHEYESEIRRLFRIPLLVSVPPTTSIDSYYGEYVSPSIIMTSVVVVVGIVKINQASGVVFLLCSTS